MAFFQQIPSRRRQGNRKLPKRRQKLAKKHEQDINNQHKHTGTSKIAKTLRKNTKIPSHGEPQKKHEDFKNDHTEQRY